MSFWHWLLTVTGINNLSGNWYGFWSGFGADLGELAIVGSIIGLYRQHKCHLCWRIGHHPVVGTHYKTCHKHATTTDHKALQAHHADKYPQQHKFLKERKS